MIELEYKLGNFISKLNSMEIHHLDGDVIELLHKNGMIIDSGADEFENISNWAKINRKKFDDSSTLFMVITPTNMCNMNCPYCYQGEKNIKKTGTKYLGKENIEALKKFVKNTIETPYAKPIKKVVIEWFGGEPLVRKNVVNNFSNYVIHMCDQRNIDYEASIITNGTLLDKKTWEMLYKCRIKSVQITIDGSEEMHDTMRVYINGNGTYQKIMRNIESMPKDKFKVTIRINGDKNVYRNLDKMFDDLERRNLWPQRNKEISFHWAPKFYNYLGYNQDKNIYYTSYEYQKSREDFAKLRLKRYNEWAINNNLKTKDLRIAYPSFAEFYCRTVESPNSVSIDDGGYVHKCYNTINDKKMRIQHIKDFDINKEGMQYYRQLDKTQQADCKTCRVLPICEETCNMRFVSKAESKICTPWKYFMNERMKLIYDQNFDKSNSDNSTTEIVSRSGKVEKV